MGKTISRFLQKRTDFELGSGGLNQVDHRATNDLDTHTLFVARVMDASSDSEEPLLTYRDYARDVRNLINDPNMSQRTG